MLGVREPFPLLLGIKVLLSGEPAAMDISRLRDLTSFLATLSIMYSKMDLLRKHLAKAYPIIPINARLAGSLFLGSNGSQVFG